MKNAKSDIAEAANDAIRVIANAAAEALKVTKAESSGDHDLLIKLETKLDGLIIDVKTLNDGTARTLSDHEARLRTLEKESEDHALVKKVVYGAVSFVLLSVLGSIVYLVVQR